MLEKFKTKTSTETSTAPEMVSSRRRKLRKAAALTTTLVVGAGFGGNAIKGGDKPAVPKIVQKANRAPVTPPSEYVQKFIDENGRPFAQAPKIHEMLQIGDKAARVTVYNTTERSVDAGFVKYAGESVQNWLKAKQDSGISLNGLVSARVKPVKAPHDLMLVKDIPAYITAPSGNGDKVPAVTVPPDDPIGYGVTTSWVKFPYELDGAAEDRSILAQNQLTHYDEYKFVAVELCQAMIEVEDVKDLPGRDRALHASEAYIGAQNGGAKGNLDLYAQEITCNSLGRIIAASYFGGEQAANYVAYNEFQSSQANAPLLDPTIAAGVSL